MGGVFRTRLWFAGRPTIGTGARYAGVVIVGAYAVVRGVALAGESPTTDRSASDIPDGGVTGSAWLLTTRVVSPDVLRRNLTAVVAGGAWLLAARLVLALGGSGRVSGSRGCSGRPPPDSCSC